MRSVSQIRARMLVLSLLLGASAFVVQHWNLLPLEEQGYVSGVFESKLLTDAIPIEALQVRVSSPAFEGAVESRARVEKVSGHPQQFRLTVEDSKLKSRELAFQRVAELLEGEIRTLALAEVKAKRAFLQQAENDASARLEIGEPTTRLAKNDVPIISPEDDLKIRRLRKEISGLEAFVQGKERPSWLGARLKRPQLKRARRDLAKAEADLKQLAETFTSTSSLYREQQTIVNSAKQELKKSELHFAEIMLSSHRAQMKSLKTKTALAMRQSRKSDSQESMDVPSRKSAAPEDESWLQARSKKLELESSAIQAASKLETISEAKTGQTVATGYWTCFALWVGSLVSLLGALFGKGEVEVIEVDEEGRPLATLPALTSPSGVQEPVQRPSSQLLPELSDPPDKLRYFFEHLCSALESGLGKRPRSLLVLGGADREDRSSLSIRIAKGFSNDGKRVRLIDFDLQDKSLSKRLGDSRSAGVGDILSSPGPVDEFFASVPDSLIQFAPAGTKRILQEPVCESTLKALLKQPDDGLVLVEAGFTSPLHLFAHKAEAVLCLSHPQKKWSDREKQVLIALRELKVPVWGLSKDRAQLFPFL